MSINEKELRGSLANTDTLVIKLGTRVITSSDGRPDLAQLEAIVSEIHKLEQKVVLVSSGAIGAGMEALGLSVRPRSLSELQMCASVGQARLMSIYDKSFSKHGLNVGQVLLTRDGLADRKRYLNIRNTIRELFQNNIIPVVNENDVVSIEELCFGDNDMLAAMVSILIDADTLLILSSTDGVQREAGKTETRVSFSEGIAEEIFALVEDSADDLSTGGMKSKLEAVRIALDAGIKTVIADGRTAEVVSSILSGEDRGTCFAPPKTKKIAPRKKWLSVFPRSRGVVVVDSGAESALLEKGVSLLPVGVTGVEGSFGPGSLIVIKNAKGDALAKGLSAYSAEDLVRLKGLSSEQGRELLGNAYADEVVHRDNMVIL